MGSKAVGEPPLMLAFSVREAIRDAVAAFGEAAGVSFDSPATPERVFFAVRRARGSSATPRPELVEGRSQKPALT
jgi:xanthine dehydrogenase large subunit